MLRMLCCAVASIFTCATAEFALSTVMGPAIPGVAPPTETPVPKLEVVEPGVKRVFRPISVTAVLSPWPAQLGEAMTAGGAERGGITLHPGTLVTCSEFVCT